MSNGFDGLLGYSNDKGIFCKRCFPDSSDDAHGGMPAHIMRVWVSGDNNLLYKKYETYPQDVTWELNGLTAIPTTLPKFINRPTMRGSFISILFKGEACDHYWIKQISFHKGDVTEEYFELDDELKISYDAMWRD